MGDMRGDRGEGFYCILEREREREKTTSLTHSLSLTLSSLLTFLFSVCLSLSLSIHTTTLLYCPLLPSTTRYPVLTLFILDKAVS